MSRGVSDADLARHFETLRREEAAAVKPFQVPRGPVRRFPAYPAWAAAAAVILVVVGTVWLVRARAAGDRGTLLVDLGTTRWVAPSDFLLETPGRDLLRTLPSIHVVDQEQATQPDVERSDTL